AFTINWGGTLYATLAAWRTATNQEKNGATSTGTSVNPQLVSAGGGGIVGDAAQLHLLTAYELLSGSPVINAGIDLTVLGVSAGSRDYYGDTPRYNGAFDVGAFESAPSLTGSAGNDAFTLRSGPSDAMDLFVNTPVGAVPTYRFASGVHLGFSVAGAGGDDTFTLDLTAGNPLPTNGVSFDG